MLILWGSFKNLVFRENWVGSKVAGMKITFFAIFDPTWTHSLAPKVQIWNSLKSILVSTVCTPIPLLKVGVENFSQTPKRGGGLSGDF